MRLAALFFVACFVCAPLAQGHEGWGIVVHDRLSVIVSDIPANSIWRITDSGAVRLLPNIHSHDLQIGDDGAIYGSNPEPESDVSSVWRLAGDGRLTYLLPPSTRSPLGLQSFLLARDGSIYSVNRYDHRRPTVVLLRRGPTGATVAVAGGAQGMIDGDSQNARFTGIDGMRELPDGTIVVADGARLRTVSRTGRVSTVTPPLTTARWGEDLLGISSPRGDVVYVADHAGRRVLRVNWKNGGAEEATKPGVLWAPAGVEQKDDLYVLEHLRPPLSILGDLRVGPYLRVRKVARDGTSVTLAIIWGERTAVAGLIAAALLFATAAFLLRRKRARAPSESRKS